MSTFFVTPTESSCDFTCHSFVKYVIDFQLVTCKSCVATLVNATPADGRGAYRWHPVCIKLSQGGKPLCDRCTDYLGDISCELMQKPVGALRFLYFCRMLYRDTPTERRLQFNNDPPRLPLAPVVEPVPVEPEEEILATVPVVPAPAPAVVAAAPKPRKRRFGGLDMPADLNQFYYGAGGSTRLAKRARGEIQA